MRCREISLPRSATAPNVVRKLSSGRCGCERILRLESGRLQSGAISKSSFLSCKLGVFHSSRLPQLKFEFHTSPRLDQTHHTETSAMFAVSFWNAFVAASFLIKLSNAQDTSPTGPTHSNIAKNCNAFHTVVDGDGCYSIEIKYGISNDDFIKWNPDVSDDCLTNFWLGSSYCVGVGAVVSTSASSKPTSLSVASSSSIKMSSSSIGTVTTAKSSPTKPSSSSVRPSATAPYSIREPVTSWNISSTTVEAAFPPKKTQEGQPSYCTNWHLVVAGETCEGIVGSATWATMAEL